MNFCTKNFQYSFIIFIFNVVTQVCYVSEKISLQIQHHIFKPFEEE